MFTTAWVTNIYRFNSEWIFIGLLIIVLYAWWYIFIIGIHRSILAFRIPGPLSFPFIGSTFLIVGRSDIVTQGLHVYKRYHKGIAKFWLFNKLAIALQDPKHVEHLLRDVKYLQKAKEYKFLKDSIIENSLLAIEDLNTWKLQRRCVTPTLYFSMLKSYVNIFWEEAIIFCDIFSDTARSGRSFDVRPAIMNCTLDIIIRTTIGIKINAQTYNKEENTFSKAVNTSLKIWHKRCLYPWLLNDNIFSLTSDKKVHDESVKQVHEFVDPIIQMRKLEKAQSSDCTNNKDKTNLLDTLIDTQAKNMMTNEQIRDLITGIILAGQDPTGYTCCFVLLMLSLHPDIQKKVHEELCTVFENNVNKNTVPSYNELKQLRYLEQVIKETLRLFTPFPGIGRRLDNDTKFGDYTIPAGSSLFLFLFAYHRNEKNFPNAEKFNPDNFSPEACYSRHAYAYIPFSAGHRNCIGKKYAMINILTVVSTILRKFLVVAGDGPSMKDFKYIQSVTLHLKDGFNIRFFQRKY